jgi:tRNA nucleotidyltransferase/poly(A) polymerase
LLKTKAPALESRILADPLIEIVFRKSGHGDIFLVGGNLRDVIMHRRSTDRDFVVDGDPRGLAAAVATDTGGKMVILGDERLCRVVLPDRSTLDFSALKDDIIGDLRQRDFTINSLGWSPKKGMIDPNNALRDLRRQVLRMTSKNNLRKDPVRIVRAYRFAAELDFTIESETRKTLKELSSLVAAAKAERITLEFFRIMNLNNPWRVLKIMLEDRALEQIILRSYNDLQAVLKVISSFDAILDVLPLNYKIKANRRFSQNLTYSGLLRLESLLPPDSRVRLTLSSKITRKLHHIEKGDAFRRAAASKGLSFEDVFFDLLELLDDAAEDYLIVTGRAELLGQYKKYQQIVRKGLLSTSEIRELCDLPEGEALGRTIRALRKAQFCNEIGDKETARQFLKRKES